MRIPDSDTRDTARHALTKFLRASIPRRSEYAYRRGDAGAGAYRGRYTRFSLGKRGGICTLYGTALPSTSASVDADDGDVTLRMGAQVSRCRGLPKAAATTTATLPCPDPRLQLWAVAAAKQEARSGADAAETLRAQWNLAKALRKAGAVGEAWALLEDVLERQLKTQGEGGEDVLQTQQSLANLLIEERARRRQPELTLPAEAQPLLGRVIAKKEHALAVELRSQGDERMAHGDTVANDDARSAAAAYTEAVQLYARALELDPDSEELPALEKLARRKAKAETGEVAKGEEGESQDTEAATWVRSKVDPLTEGLGDYGAARPLEEAVAAGFASRFGANDERTVQARMQLARTLRRLGQHEAARPEYEAVLAAKGDADGEFAVQRTSRVIAQANLAELLYENLGEHEEVRSVGSCPCVRIS